MRVLDCTYGEGGGQIVRTAIGLSALTGESIDMRGIRHGRKDTGLKAQHVSAFQALARLCDAESEGVHIGSEHVTFRPGAIKGGTVTLDIGTAGSITLLLQALLPAAIFASKTVRLRLCGGTDTSWSMPWDYFSNVLVPQLSRYTIKFTCKLRKRGYYPKGGGDVEVRIQPAIARSDFNDFNAFLTAVHEKFPPITLLEQGELMAIRGVSHAHNSLEDAQVVERQARAAARELTSLKRPLRIRQEYASGPGAGSGITLWAVFSPDGDTQDPHNPVILGADALGAPGTPSEKVGFAAAHALLHSIGSGAAVDAHLADNLIPYMGLHRTGSILIDHITSHTLTNMRVVEQMIGVRFKHDEGAGVIRIASRS